MILWLIASRSLNWFHSLTWPDWFCSLYRPGYNVAFFVLLLFPANCSTRSKYAFLLARSRKKQPKGFSTPSCSWCIQGGGGIHSSCTRGEWSSANSHPVVSWCQSVRHVTNELLFFFWRLCILDCCYPLWNTMYADVYRFGQRRLFMISSFLWGCFMFRIRAVCNFLLIKSYN